MLRKIFRWLAIALVPVLMGLGLWIWRENQLKSKLPAGIVSGNGRIESVQVDVSTKYAGRVRKILAREGDLVKTGQVVAQMDTNELEAELARGKAKVAEAEETENQIKAEILEKESQLKFSQQQFERDKALFSRRVISREEMEQSQTKRDVSSAAVDSVKAKLLTNLRTIEAATADVKRTQTQIVDSTLTSPVPGRVLYRLAEEGEVLAAGGKVFTLVNLGDVYMEIFLPSQEAARIELGADARIVLDGIPQYAALANVTFVSPEAQFTPKQVETRSERDKLMFRVKLHVPQELLLPYIEKVKTGVRGVGYVKIDESATWPDSLEHRFPRPPVKSHEAPALKPEEAPSPEAGSEPKTEAPTSLKEGESPVPKTEASTPSPLPSASE